MKRPTHVLLAFSFRSINEFNKALGFIEWLQQKSESVCLIFLKTFRWSDLGLTEVSVTMSVNSGALLQNSKCCPSYEN